MRYTIDRRTVDLTEKNKIACVAIYFKPSDFALFRFESGEETDVVHLPEEAPKKNWALDFLGKCETALADDGREPFEVLKDEFEARQDRRLISIRRWW